VNCYIPHVDRPPSSPYLVSHSRVAAWAGRMIAYLRILKPLKSNRTVSGVAADAERMPQLAHLAIPLAAIDRSVGPDVEIVAELLERGARARFAKYGYGPGEALITAYGVRPEVIQPLVSEVIPLWSPLGSKPSDRDTSVDAAAALMRLHGAVCEILSERPKAI
jgi:hypothetical protein